MNILKVYALAEDAIPGKDCTGRACCCHFDETGREPFVTDMELRVLLDELKRQGRRVPPARGDGSCPMLTGDGLRCTVYEARPLGCRTHFCREAGGPATARQVRDALQLLNELNEKSKRRGGRNLRGALEDARHGKQP